MPVSPNGFPRAQVAGDGAVTGGKGALDGWMGIPDDGTGKSVREGDVG